MSRDQSGEPEPPVTPRPMEAAITKQHVAAAAGIPPMPGLAPQGPHANIGGFSPADYK